jgi:hypothetical protein
MIFTQKFTQRNSLAKIENPQTNPEKGMWGEQKGSEHLTSLKIHHNHHDFSNVEAYSSSSNHGPDLWDGDFFQIEVKYYPNSWLSENNYYEKVKSRFDPSIRLKICIVIEGYIPKNVLSLFKKDNIILIWITEKSLIPKLKALLNYYFTVYGYWNRFIVFRPCSEVYPVYVDLDIVYLLASSFVPFSSQIEGDPPPEIDLLGDEMLPCHSVSFISKMRYLMFVTKRKVKMRCLNGWKNICKEISVPQMQ